MRLQLTVLVAALVLSLPAMSPAQTITGTASYRERIAAPPDARFEAVLEDISLADVPAVVMGRAVIEAAGNPPYAFQIAYDAQALRPGHRYAVRATLRQGDRLLFTTDTVAPVLTTAEDTEVTLRLVQVRSTADAQVFGAHGLRLPASFTGTLPCADCEGIAHHLDLWPDQGFALRRTYLGKDAAPEDVLGRWSADAAGQAIVLHGTGTPPLRFEVTAPDRLRLLAQDGSPIESDLPYDLAGGPLAPTDLTAPVAALVRYMADAATVELCATGQRYPVALEGDWLALERAYRDARAEPGAPVLALAQISLAERPGMDGGTPRTAVIERYLGLRPGASCARQRTTAALTGTYWKLVELGGTPVTPVPEAREPHMVLRGGTDAGVAATAGCNRIAGGYALGEDGLRFGALAMTSMMCPEPLAALERGFAAALTAAEGHVIAGQSLILTDGDGQPLAGFDAVYLY